MYEFINLDLIRKFRNTAFFDRRFTHVTVKSEILKLKKLSQLKITTIGHSVENREIYRVRFGHGPTKLLFWSQMHGNEPTATAAIFDILNVLTQTNDIQNVIEMISNQFTLDFIPMLNPDGAERFQRENALNIDLNRDALSKSMPETQALWDYQSKFKPDIGFNLHDQKTHYNVTGTRKTATLSFLAPAFNSTKEINKNREFAMKSIVLLNKIASEYIPNHIARYDDTHGPRCVGDQFQNKGIATILIESGAFKNDIERQSVRDLNSILLLNYLIYHHQNKIEEIDTADYFNIPENDTKLFDLLIRNIEFQKGGQTVKFDIGLRFIEFTDLQNRSYHVESIIEEVGDLSTFYGIQEFDAKGFDCVFGKQVSRSELDKNETFDSAIQKGITAVKKYKFDKLRRVSEIKYEFKVDCGMDFVFYKNDEIRVVIINDKIIECAYE